MSPRDHRTPSWNQIGRDSRGQPLQQTVVNVPVDPDMLPERQQTVLAAIGPDGITPFNAGRLIYPHADTGHAIGYGRAILKALKKKGLVVERRRRGQPHRYELANKPVEPLGELPTDY